MNEPEVVERLTVHRCVERLDEAALIRLGSLLESMKYSSAVTVDSARRVLEEMLLGLPSEGEPR